MLREKAVWLSHRYETGDIYGKILFGSRHWCIQWSPHLRSFGKWQDGLWMIQSVKKEIGQDYSFGEICEMASKTDIASIVDGALEDMSDARTVFMNPLISRYINKNRK